MHSPASTSLRPKSAEPEGWSAVIIGLSFGFFFATLDTSVAILGSPTGLSRPGNVLAATAVAFLAYVVAFAPLSLIIPIARRSLPSIDAFAAHATVGVFIASVGALAMLHLNRGTGISSTALVWLGIMALGALGLAAGTYVIFRVPGLRERHLTLLSLLPLTGALAVIALWLYRFAFTASWSAAAVVVALVAAALTCKWLIRWDRRGLTRVKGLLGLAIALLMAALVSQLEVRIPPAKKGSSAPRLDPVSVILLTVDTLRADALSLYSERGESTPSIERLARDGVLFARAISPGPWTKPAFGSMLTGLSPRVHGATSPKSVLPARVETLAERMAAAGYRTAAIGLNPVLGPRLNFGQGFDEYHWFPRPTLGNSVGGRLLTMAFEARFGTYVTSAALTNMAIAWLRRNQHEPFLLWLHYYDPHDPFTPPKRFLSDTAAVGSLGPRFERAKDLHSGIFTPSRLERAWIKELYLAEVRYVEAEIDRLLSALHELGIYDDSLIVLAADHGEEFWEHGRFGHGRSLSAELLDVPLIIKLPNSRARGRVDYPVSTGSVTPTILELCELEVDDRNLSYASLAPNLRSETVSRRIDPVVSTGVLHGAQSAVLLGRSKYLYDSETEVEQLYDRTADGSEVKVSDGLSRAEFGQGRELLKEHERESERIRLRLGLPSVDGVAPHELDKESIAELEALGYL